MLLKTDGNSTNLGRYVTAKELSLLGQTSKAFFCFCAAEELWKEQTLDDFDGNFQFHKTWRETYRKMKSLSKGLKFVECIPPHVEGNITK